MRISSMASRIISIHAPRVGSDDVSSSYYVHDYISIHAPRVGSDSLHFTTFHVNHDFNPRSPRGERHLPYKSQDVRG